MRIPRIAILAMVVTAACHSSPAAPLPPGVARAVRVQGNQLGDSAGRPVRLRGVNRSGTEYACAQGWGFFDGPSDSMSVQAIASWNTNAVRVPLNETCWLGINGVAPAYSGDNYRQTISAFVGRLNRAGLVVILELHWSAADTAVALGQAPTPDRDHTPEFWRPGAAAYGSHNRRIFDLVKQPGPASNPVTPGAWGR